MHDRLTNPWKVWKEGEEPEPSKSRKHKPFQEGQAPNCPEYPRDKWQKDKHGKWIDPEFCTIKTQDGEELVVVNDADDDELGNAESSENDEN